MNAPDPATSPPENRPSEEQVADARRREIHAETARTVLDAATRRLTEAVAAYEEALDRRPLMSELQYLDREVAQAEREHAAARKDAAAAAGPGRGGPTDDPSVTAP